MVYLGNRLASSLTHGIDSRIPCRYHDTRAHVDEILHGVKDQTRDRTGGADIQECIRLAAFIYNNTCFRDIPPASAIHSHLIRQLKLSLVSSKLFSVWTDYQEVLMWILFIGGAVSIEVDCRSWVLGLLKQTCDGLGLLDWNTVHERLRTFLWVDQFCEGPCRTLWIEMLQLHTPGPDSNSGPILHWDEP